MTWAVKDEHSRDPVKVRHKTRNKDDQNQKKNTTQKTQTMGNTDPPKKQGVQTGARDE